MARALRGVRGMRRSSARARALRLPQGSPLPRGLQRSRQPGCSCDARALNGGLVGVMAQVPEIVRSRSRARSAGRVETRHARCGVRTGHTDVGESARTSFAGERSLPAACVRAQRPPSPQISAALRHRTRSRFIAPHRGETQRSEGGESLGLLKKPVLVERPNVSRLAGRVPRHHRGGAWPSASSTPPVAFWAVLLPISVRAAACVLGLRP